MEFLRHHRTICAIGHEADRLNVECIPDNWTADEDDLLAKLYPTHDDNDQTEYINGRTVKACKSRAVVLGLKKTALWSEADNDILRQYYPIEGNLVANRFNGRYTKHQCATHAKTLGLHATTNSADKWTEEDDAIITAWYPLEGKACYKRIPGTSASTVMSRACVLNVKYLKSKVLAKAVRCLETGEVFTSCYEAVKKYPGHLSQHLNGQRPNSGKLPDGTKLHWEYVDKETNDD